MNSNMTWNVYYHNINAREIQLYNIFRHGGFQRDVTEALQSCVDRESFAAEVKSSLMYYFWCKCEWEIVIAPWCGGNNDKPRKVDIYSQVMLNWDAFIDYVWAQRPTEAQK